MSLIEYLAESKILFRKRATAIPPDMRPIWRISMVLLILRNASWNNRSSLSRLHVLNWAIRSPENRQNLLHVIKGELAPDKIVVRIEPSLIRALQLASGESLIDFVKGKSIQLTSEGVEAASQLNEATDILLDEKSFLSLIGKRGLTEQLVRQIFSEGFE